MSPRDLLLGVLTLGVPPLGAGCGSSHDPAQPVGGPLAESGPAEPEPAEPEPVEPEPVEPEPAEPEPVEPEPVEPEPVEPGSAGPEWVASELVVTSSVVTSSSLRLVDGGQVRVAQVGASAPAQAANKLAAISGHPLDCRIPARRGEVDIPP